VTRTLRRTAIAASLLLAVTFTAGLVVSNADAAPSLRGKLQVAQRQLKKANERLAAAQTALEAALAADSTTAAPDATPVATPGPTPAAAPAALASTSVAAAPVDVAALKAKVAQARKQVSAWKKKVRALSDRVQQEEHIAAWEREGDWMPIIKIAAARYNVKADGMYRMMMRESGGNARAGASSSYKGLYQYWTGTWNNDWNPWRAQSIYDGSSQIFATAYALHKGMGAQMWTTTYASQY
jgi:soluble lytic murein transglycosylase-like protein